MSKLPRFWVWTVFAVLLAVGVGIYSPQQFPVMLYKLSMITMAATIAYWIDEEMFGRKSHFSQHVHRDNVTFTAARMLARALIYVGTVLGISLGL